MNTPTVHVKRSGESYGRIMQYFLPELVTTLLIYSFLTLYDQYWIAGLKATAIYTTAGVTQTLIMFLTKIAEAIGVGTVVLVGHHNGRNEHHDVGKAAISSFWAMAFFGAIICCLLYVGAYGIYWMYRVPENMIHIGVPFLRIRALSIFFMFLYFGFTGFMRGIKNTRVPMVLYVLGGVAFMFFDFALIQGRCGFSAYAFQGSALASLIQYVVMCLGAVIYLFASKDVRVYALHGIKSFKIGFAWEVMRLSFPIMLDKATIAGAKMFLTAMFSPLGQAALGSYCFMKEFEQFALIPVLAFASVITFLASNDAGAGNWLGVRNNLQKILILSLIFLLVMFAILFLNINTIIGWFDREHTFTEFSLLALPIISILSLFDLLQAILAAALRGVGDVKAVMTIRWIGLLAFCVPASLLVAYVLPINNVFIKFILLYGVFYITNGLTSLLYIRRLTSKEWHLRLTQDSQ
jgi:MATE family multidrug resistance protein